MTPSSIELVEEPLPSDERREANTVIARAQAGDAGAFAEIFQAYSRRVTGLCRHMLRDRELADDAAGEVFLRLRTAIATYDGSAEFDRWLLRITANHCIDLTRRRQLERRWMSEEGDADDSPSTEASPLTLLLLKERRDAIARAVETLDEAYRLPLVLRYYAALSYDEIGTELNMEKTQVAGRIFRAKHMLRKLLEEKVR
jgi:RNA polymerase sigma-70 factor (ECF subfamily)